MISIHEEDIFKSWNQTVADYDPFVTVRITAYNHEEYIASAIESALSQETEYPFQIFIHDDCSSDNTAKIIRDYQEKYPHLINAIYETENQYSKHDGSLERITIENLKGKYVAICEGDDYWIDNKKLQKQIRYMEEHDDCSLTFTNGMRFDVKTGQFGPVFTTPEEIESSKQNQVITMANCTMFWFPPTASYVFRIKDYAPIKCVPLF